MRKVILLSLLVLSIALPLMAENGGPKNAVSVDPIWLLVNTYKGSYERVLFDQFTLRGEISYSPDFLFGLHNYNTLTYLDVIGEGRYYFGSLLKDAAGDVDMFGLEDILRRVFTDALGGLYGGAFLGYVNSTVEDGDGEIYYKGSMNGFGGGITLGAKYIFSDGALSFFVEPYGVLRFYGGGWTFSDLGGNTIPKPEGFKDGFDRNGFTGGVNIGLSF